MATLQNDLGLAINMFVSCCIATLFMREVSNLTHAPSSSNLCFSYCFSLEAKEIVVCALFVIGIKFSYFYVCPIYENFYLQQLDLISSLTIVEI